MPPPVKTVWELKEHTKGKHLVLRAYLEAWLPILGSWSGRILFVDAFAGPGEYKDGEEGSPIIALNALIEHNSKSTITAEVIFFFIESEEDRANYLTDMVDQIKPRIPSNAKFQVIHGTFDQTMTEVLNQIEEQNTNLAPCFVMIDPFGVKGMPMTIIQRILNNPKSEVYISFMYEGINRFRSTPEFEPHLNELFGCDNWKQGVGISDSHKRRKFFFDLYKDQLKKAGCKFVLSFDLYDDNRHIYTIFFGTQHLRGCDVMKQAIWKIAPTGNYRFVGTNSDQLTLSIVSPNFAPLKKALQDEFIGKGWVSIEDVLEFVISDKTDYHSGQVKTKVLKLMEDCKEPEIEVDKNSRKRRNTYPPKTILRFLDKEES